MATEVTTLELNARLTNAEQTIAGLQRIDQAGGQAEMSFGKLAMQIAGLNTGFGLVVQAGQKVVSFIKDTVKESVVLAVSFEKSRMAWGVLVGDMNKGSQMFDKLFTFAQKTVLSFEGVNQSATLLRSYGIETEKILPTMKMLGDISMGDNDRLSRLSLAYGQMSSAGRLMGQDLLQMISVGFNPLLDISKRTGESMLELRKRMEQGKISSAEVEEAFFRVTQAGGQFDGMLNKISATTAGKFANAQDSVKAILSDIGTTMIPAINRELDYWNAKLGDIINTHTQLKYITTGRGDGQGIVADLKSQIAQQKAIAAQTGQGPTGGWAYDLFHQGTWINPGTGEEQSGWSPVYNRGFEAQAMVQVLEARLKAAEQVLKDQQWNTGEHGGGSSLGPSGYDAPALTSDQVWSAGFKASTGSESLADYMARVNFEVQAQLKVAHDTSKDFLGVYSGAASDVQKTMLTLAQKGLYGPTTRTTLSAFYASLTGNANPSNTYQNRFDYMSGIPTAQPGQEPIVSNASWGNVPYNHWGGAIDTTNPVKNGPSNPLAVDAQAQAMDRLKASMLAVGESSIVSTFDSIGKALAAGASGADSMAQSMQSIVSQAASQSGALMMNAGLTAMMAGQFEIGIPLFLAGGGMEILGGYMSASNSTSGTSTGSSAADLAALTAYYQQTEAFNQQARKSSALSGYASGTNYAMGGWSWVGERGPELMRVPTGSQIIPNHVARGYADGLNVPGSATVNVNIAPPSGYEATQSETVDSSGARSVEVAFRRIARGEIARASQSARRVSS